MRNGNRVILRKIFVHNLRKSERRQLFSPYKYKLIVLDVTRNNFFRNVYGLVLLANFELVEGTS